MQSSQNSIVGWKLTRCGAATSVLIGLLVLGFAAFTGEGADQKDRGRAFRPQPSPNMLRVGETAPDFDLMRLECIKTEGEKKNGLGRSGGGAEKVGLSSFRGKKPVFIIFASYT